jgi:hypothetical protein
LSVEFQPGGHSILQDQGRAKIVCETGFALGQSIPPIAYPVFPKLFPVTSEHYEEVAKLDKLFAERRSADLTALNVNWPALDSRRTGSRTQSSPETPIESSVLAEVTTWSHLVYAVHEYARRQSR